MSFRRILFAAQNSITSRLGSAVLFIASYTWWLYNRGAGDRIIAVIGAGFAFATTNVFIFPGKVSAHDSDLFKKFNESYPYNAWIPFLENHCFGQPFPHSRLDQLDSIMNQWAPNPLMHFQDRRVEKNFSELITAINQFRNKLSLEIHQLGGESNDPWYGIPKPSPWTEEGQKAYEQAFNDTNRLANNVVIAYKAWAATAMSDLLD